MQIESYTELTADQAAEWRVFQASSRHQHPRQDPRFAEVERATGKTPLFTMGRRNGQLCAVGLFSLQRHPFLPGKFAEACCLSGPICDDAAEMAIFLDGLAKRADFSQVGRVKVTPYWVQEEAETLGAALRIVGWAPSEPEPFRATGWVDLARPTEEIFAAFSKSARRELRRAERQGIITRPITEEAEAKVFLDSLNCMRGKRGLGVVDVDSFLVAFRRMYGADDGGILLGAWHEGNFVAGLQLYRSCITAHGRHFTTETARLSTLSNLRIAPFLWFEGMKWAKSKGCTALDVEGWRESADVTDRKYNIYKYKSEFAPIAVRRIAEHAKTIRPLMNLTGNAPSLVRAKISMLIKAMKKMKA